MKVISPTFPGRIAICPTCGALLGDIKDSDIYGKDMYCLVCKQKIPIDYDKNYDGIVKEQEIKEKNE